MTKEELTVKIWQRSTNSFTKTKARRAIERNTEALFISDLLTQINNFESLKHFYIHILGEDLYNELQKFKTEK